MKHIYTLFAILAIYTVQAQTIELTVHAPDANAVKLTGPWWGWDPNGGPTATANGDGSFTVSMTAGGENMQYLWVADGVQESLVADAAAANCGGRIDAGARMVTDYTNYANRVWILGDGNIDNDVYGTCAHYPNDKNTFDNPLSSLGWTAVADAAGAATTEASLSFNATAGNPGGALEIFGSNPTAGAGKAYIYDYLISDFKYNGATKVVMNYDIKIVSADYAGTAIHVFLHTTNGGGGLAQNNFMDQQAGTAFDTFVAKSHEFTGITPAGNSDQLKMTFQLAAGADAGAGARIFIDNLQLVGYDASDNVTFRIDDVDDFKLNLYPNPVKNIATISATETIEMVRIYDLTGRMVKQLNPNKSEFSLNVSDLSKGAYLVKLNAGNKEATTKFIK